MWIGYRFDIWDIGATSRWPEARKDGGFAAMPVVASVRLRLSKYTDGGIYGLSSGAGGGGSSRRILSTALISPRWLEFLPLSPSHVVEHSGSD